VPRGQATPSSGILGIVHLVFLLTIQSCIGMSSVIPETSSSQITVASIKYLPKYVKTTQGFCSENAHAMWGRVVDRTRDDEAHGDGVFH